MSTRLDTAPTSVIPRLVVNVASGPHLGRKAVLEPGSELRVGRAPGAGLCVGDDPEMAGYHLELASTGEGHRLRDLGSVAGTLVDGERVREAAVGHATWVRAGATDLLLCHEGWSACHAAPTEDPPELAAHKARALDLLREARPCYAVLDAARDGWVLGLLREAVDETSCLFDPPEAQTLFRVAPFVVRLRAGSSLLEHLVRIGWGQAWGVFLGHDRPLSRVRCELQRVLESTNPATGAPAYFRFYDPRVLRTHLRQSSVAARAELFGDVAWFVVEGADGSPERYDRAGP
jgi:hypothetical protein